MRTGVYISPSHTNMNRWFLITVLLFALADALRVRQRGILMRRNNGLAIQAAYNDHARCGLDDKIIEPILDDHKVLIKRYSKPLMIGFFGYLVVAVIILYLFSDNSEHARGAKSTLLWVLAFPIGILLVSVIVFLLVYILAMAYDVLADGFKDKQFELIFLFLLLIALLVMITVIRLRKRPLTWTDHILPREVVTNVLYVAIIASYLNIAIEWLKRNYGSVFGFTVLAVSLYLLYVFS